MRFAALSIVALASVAIAGPVQKRQDASDLDALLDAYDAVPDVPDLAPPMGAITSTATVTYDATAVVAAATSAAATGLTKRDTLEQRDVDPAGCVIDHASGLYKGTVSPDTPDQFSADMGMQNLALNAATPPGYFLVNGYKNLKASASAPGYKTMWQDNIASYDPAFCAAGCNKMAGCNTFVIYFERDNKYVVDSCPAGSITSQIVIKCAFYSTPLTSSQALNFGQYKGSSDPRFHVLITGANAYTTAPQPLPNYDGPFSLGSYTINAPSTAPDSYMGVQTFPGTQPFDPSVCAAGCDAKTAYNSRHPASDGTYRKCVFFDAYMMYKDGAGGQFTCTYYTDAWDASWATNGGQTRGGSVYAPGSSYTYKVAGTAWQASKV